MDEKELVRVCPGCDDHPPYLPGTLQCVECGAIRPRRLSLVTWHSCVKGATEPAQDALDCEFHSARPSPVRAFVDIECHFLGTYRILTARLAAAASSAPIEISEAEAMRLVQTTLASHGLIATV